MVKLQDAQGEPGQERAWLSTATPTTPSFGPSVPRPDRRLAELSGS